MELTFPEGRVFDPWAMSWDITTEVSLDDIPVEHHGTHGDIDAVYQQAEEDDEYFDDEYSAHQASRAAHRPFVPPQDIDRVGQYKCL